MKNFDNQIQIQHNLANGIVSGVKVDIVPEIGMSVGISVGSDTYGYKVISCSKDKTEFVYGNKHGEQIYDGGIAKLQTRKNSKDFGNYVMYYQDNDGKWTFAKGFQVWLSNDEIIDNLDPSF